MSLVERLREWIKYWKVSSQVQPVLETAEKLIQEAADKIEELEAEVEAAEVQIKWWILQTELEQDAYLDSIKEDKP